MYYWLKRLHMSEAPPVQAASARSLSLSLCDVGPARSRGRVVHDPGEHGCVGHDPGGSTLS